MRFRAPVLADAPAVHAVLAARERIDFGTPISGLEDLWDEWQRTELELESDARVVEADEGGIVAYVAVRRQGTRAAVAPDHEGRGIGARLLEWAEQRERAHGHSMHRQWVPAANAAARELLTGAGYARARSYWRLVRSLDAIEPARAAPAGISLGKIDVARDALRLHALDDSAFSTAADYAPMSFEEFREEHLEAHDFDAGLSLLAQQGEEIVACLLARRHDDEGVGYVAGLAVDPGHQRRGIGTALLEQAFAGFAAAGLERAQLMVASDNPRALRLYERVGMSVELQVDIYERSVGSSPSRWRSYRDVDAAPDPDSLGRQLDDLAAIPFIAAEKHRSLELLALRAGDRVLDVGCGNGPELEPLAELVGSDGCVVGLERSAALIAEGRKRGRDRPSQVQLVGGDAAALPFEDGEFDACRADRTLQHVEQPERALREMARVVRAGGRVVVTESRWGLVAPSLDQTVTDRVLGSLASGVEQAGWVGYRLPGLFEEAGLTDVRSLRADNTTSGAEELFSFTHVRSAAAQAAGAGVLSPGDAADWLSQLEALAACGDAFAMVLILHVVGSKPVG
jgi:mycothiol synthase